MTEAKDVAAGYGEGDIEAKAMTNAAEDDANDGTKRPEAVPPPDAFVPAAGTTETDVAEELRQKAERESKS